MNFNIKEYFLSVIRQKGRNNGLKLVDLASSEGHSLNFNNKWSFSKLGRRVGTGNWVWWESLRYEQAASIEHSFYFANLSSHRKNQEVKFSPLGQKMLLKLIGQTLI